MSDAGEVDVDWSIVRVAVGALPAGGGVLASSALLLTHAEGAVEKR